MCIRLASFSSFASSIPRLNPYHKETYRKHFDALGSWTTDDTYWSVPKAMLSLFQILTMDSWNTKLVRPIVKEFRDSDMTPLCS